MHHDVRQVGGIRGEVNAQPVEIRQSAGVKVSGEQIGELGLAAALVRQGEQIDHEPTGPFVG